jgi:hypothetical protein
MLVTSLMIDALRMPEICSLPITMLEDTLPIGAL